MVAGDNAFTISDVSSTAKSIAVMAWNVSGNSISTAVSADITDYIYPVIEAFTLSDDTVTLPYSDTVNLGGEGSTLYNFDGNNRYARLIKVEAEAGQLLKLEFYGVTEKTNTVIEIYRQLEGEYVRGIFSNDDNKNGYGESALYLVPEDGVYYIAFWGYNISVSGICQTNVEPIEDTTVLTDGLDFTSADIPEPQPQALRKWDAESLTLTLMDGCCFYSDNYFEYLIFLPDGATVVIGGNVSMTAYVDVAIYGLGELTICGAAAQVSVLSILKSDTAIYSVGDLRLENLSLNLKSYGTNLSSDASVTLQNVAFEGSAQGVSIGAAEDLSVFDSAISIYGPDCGLYIPYYGGEMLISDSVLNVEKVYSAIFLGEGNLNIINSDISVISANMGIEVDNGDMLVIDSDITLATMYELGISCAGDSVILGGKMSLLCYNGCFGIYGRLVIYDTAFDFTNEYENYGDVFNGDKFLIFSDEDVCLYGYDGTLLYKGAWDASFVDKAEYTLLVDGKKVARLTNLHEYRVTVSGGGINGGDDAEVVVVSGDEVTVTANSASAGKQFKGWSTDGGETIISTNETYTFTVSEDIELTAIFEEVSTEPTEPTDPTDPTDTTEPEGLSGGAIAGIAVGSVAGALVLVYAVCAVLYKKKVLKAAFFGKIFPFIK